MTKSQKLDKALDDLFDQVHVLKHANEDELEIESKRAASMVQTMEPIIAVVEAEVKLINGSGLVPQNAALVSSVKDIIEKKPESKGLLVDEFTRK